MFAYSFELSRLFCDVSAFYLSALVTFPQNFNLIYYSSVPPLQPFRSVDHTIELIHLYHLWTQISQLLAYFSRLADKEEQINEERREGKGKK